MAHQAKHLKQSVTLTGFNGLIFAKCIENIRAVDALFSANFCSDEATPWDNENYLNYSAVTFSNRYFTDNSRMSYLQGVPFTCVEDPSGKMAALGKECGLLHCEENAVKYFSLKEDRYVQISSPCPKDRSDQLK